MSTDTPRTIFLKDYTRPDYQITKTFLDFSIHDGSTRVKSRLECIADSTGGQPPRPLVLNGENMTLISVAINGNPLEDSAYTVAETTLTITCPPPEFTLEIEIEIQPETNKSCEGLYQSGDIFCTQNEPEGFRKITYFLDRSDVMSMFTTRIEADRTRFPVLLSNGNKTESGDLSGGRHFVTWEDPFCKPSYLFALVAGDLAMVDDVFTTRSGRTIPLQIFVDKGNEDRAQHSLNSLKSSMKWDEERFGLEYDLDIYMIVAVDSFNMGAMENKGLNIFNSRCALANPKTATDSDFQSVERVIAHEYFHNWTGNRITCRDWFQLTLKEGLTVFRDQEYSADTMSRPVHRIQTVASLRNSQFVEDGGPMAHPIKPASYIEINNFYTATVYNKGAEVIRMIQTLIGRETFRKGMDKYVELFDGQAVTTDDFIKAMEIASGLDLTQFRETWYTQAGTPVVDMSTEYDAVAQTYSITVKQSCRPTPECAQKKPYHMPIVLGLLDAQGMDMPLNLEGHNGSVPYLNVTQAEESFVFKGITEKPVPSLLRDFSAPVILNYDYTRDDLIFLLAHDNDPFNRYETGQRMGIIELERLITAYQQGQPMVADPSFIAALGAVLADNDLDDALKAEALALPTVTALVERMEICDFEAAWAARDYLREAVASTHESIFKAIYDSRISFDGDYSVAPSEVGKRALQNTALGYLIALEAEDYIIMAVNQFENANNMTDEMAAFTNLCQLDSQKHSLAIESFYQKWSNDSLVINKWFAVQASSKFSSVLDDVKCLAENPAFDATNPNKIRSLYSVYAANTRHFHMATGEGYEFIADKILEIDSFNPMIASGLALAFRKFANLDAVRQGLMRTQLERLLAKEGLSKDVFEIISKTLA
ncbi:aminopeptidase N [bacterium F16]|nr:aminopeptidase N [bacterium F16]